MDVKFITVTRENFPTVPVIDGQVITIYDEPGLYYDMDSARRRISSTIFCENLEDVTSPEEGVLYALNDEENDDRGVYIYLDGEWICLAETYDKFIGATQNLDGESGLVPAPEIAERAKYLRGDGVWSYTPYPAWNRDYGDEDDGYAPEGYDVVDNVITPDSKNPVTSAILYKSFREKQDLHKSGVYTLVSNRWNSTTYTQKVYIDSETAQDAVFVSPKDDSINLYINYEIECVEQGDDYLIFHCGLLPTSDIKLNIAILHYVDLEPEQVIVDDNTVSTANALKSGGPIVGAKSTSGEVDPIITPDSQNPVMSSAIYAALLLKQNQHLQSVVSLPVNGWDPHAKTIEVRVKGATEENLVFVAPDVDSYREYLQCSVKCIYQTSSRLTFDCAEIPSNTLNVNVLILD